MTTWIVAIALFLGGPEPLGPGTFPLGFGSVAQAAESQAELRSAAEQHALARVAGDAVALVRSALLLGDHSALALWPGAARDPALAAAVHTRAGLALLDQERLSEAREQL